MFYAGIGSRETPENILNLMEEISIKLDKIGYTVRSGGADGADLAFERKVSKKEVYIPWKGFNKSNSPLIFDKSENMNLALSIAAENHFIFDKLSPPVKNLMGRNVYQILGSNLDKSVDFVVCWTKDGCESHKTRKKETGGTGLAISVASKLGIKIYNLKNNKSKKDLFDFIDEFEI